MEVNAKFDTSNWATEHSLSVEPVASWASELALTFCMRYKLSALVENWTPDRPLRNPVAIPATLFQLTNSAGWFFFCTLHSVETCPERRQHGQVRRFVGRFVCTIMHWITVAWNRSTNMFCWMNRKVANLKRSPGFYNRTLDHWLSRLVMWIPAGLTSWSRVFEKLTGSQLVKKFSAFYGTLRFITAFMTAR
jgi:hypothetical protein